MLTTAGLMRSATSAKFTTPASDAGRGRSLGAASRAVAVDTTGVLGTPPPARMMPTRNATVDESASVMNVKRLDIVRMPRIRLPEGLRLLYYCPERLFRQRLDPQRLGFLQLAAGVGADNQIVTFFG